MKNIENSNVNFKKIKKKVGIWSAKGFATAVMLVFSYIAWIILMLEITISSNVTGWSFGFISVVLPAILMFSLNVLINYFLWYKKLKARKTVIIICVSIVAVCIVGIIVLIATAPLRPEYVSFL